MGYIRKEHIRFKLVCEECGESIEGGEDFLINEGWLWYRVNREKFAYCPKHRNLVARKIKDFFGD